MNGLTRFLIAIVVIGIFALVALQFNNYQKGFDSQKPKEEANLDPCSYPLDTMPIFNGIRIGMKKKDYKFKVEQIDYADESDKGIITWEPIWNGDSLVALRLKFISDWDRAYPSRDLIMSYALAHSAFSAMFYKRLDLRTYEYITSDDQFELKGKRISITIFKDIPTIYASDLCFESLDNKARRIQDSTEAAKSKALF